DVTVWRELLARVETTLCKIDVRAPGKDLETGTGFLVGPDIMLTNYHVLENVIQKNKPGWVKLHFDYKHFTYDRPPHTGQTYSLLDTDWLLDASPYSPLDKLADPPEEPDSNLLDYALVRIAGTPGQDRATLPPPVGDGM